MWEELRILILCICGEVGSNPTVFLPYNKATVLEHGWSHYLHFIKEDCEMYSPGCLYFVLQMVLDTDWALWAWLCFSLQLVLSGLLYPEDTVHMERLAGILKAVSSCSVCWCTWTKSPSILCCEHLACTFWVGWEENSVARACFRLFLCGVPNSQGNTNQRIILNPRRVFLWYRRHFPSVFLAVNVLCVYFSHLTASSPWLFCVCVYFF